MAALEARINYADPGTGRLRSYIGDAPPGEPQSTVVHKPQTVTIHDARAHGAFSLDREGMAFLRFETDFRDYDDEQAVRSRYYPEIESFVRAQTGASRALAFEHAVRRRLPGTESRSGYSLRRPLDYIHIDYTPASGPRLVKETLGDEEGEALLQQRVEIVNFWRPIKGPLRDAPLALCDASSMAPEDLLRWERILPDKRYSEMYLIGPNPAHRWFYLPEMRADEGVLFRGYDSNPNGQRRIVAHTAFEDPAAPENVLPRESIEVRLILSFPQ